MCLPESKPKSILIWQMPGCFAGEDQHRLAHYRLEPMLRSRLGENCPSFRFATGTVEVLIKQFEGLDRPDALVLPTFREHTWQSLEMAGRLASVAPQVPVFLSGWGSDPDYLDQIAPRLAHPKLFVMRGEVEASLADCLEGMLRREGLSIEAMIDLGAAIPDADGGWRSRGRFREIADLSILPSPYRQGRLSAKDFANTMLVEVARGCLFHCRFCLSCNYVTRRPRFFPQASILEEIRFAFENRFQSIGFLCSGLNYDIELLENIAEAFGSYPQYRKPLVESTIHASMLDARRLASIRKLPWRRMIIGLQSTNPKALEAMGRSVDLGKFREAIVAISEFHIPVVELILGLPGDTLEGFVNTMRFVLDLPVNIEVYALRLDPGSEFFTNRLALGLEADFSRQGRVISTPTFSSAQLERAGWALRQLANNPWTHRARRLGFDFECLYEQRNQVRGATA